MRIVSVNFTGIDDLYSLCRNQGVGKTMNNLGKRFDNILNHVDAHIHIDGMTAIEALYMKQFVSGEMVDVSTSMIDSDEDYERLFPEETFPDMQPTIKTIIKVLPDIERDVDVSFKPGPMLLPAGCILKEAIIKIRGRSLMIVLNRGLYEIWNAVFINSETGEPLPESARPDEFDTTNRELMQRFENIFVNVFIEEFYKFMDDDLETIDKVADPYIYNKYYKYMKNALDCTISDIYTPVGCVRFFGNQDVQKDIDTVKGEFSKNRELAPFYAENIILNFTASTSLYTFIELMMMLPYGMITDYNDIKQNLYTDTIPVPRELAKYKSRVINKLKILNAVKLELVKANIMQIARYNFILLSTPVKFNISISGKQVGEIKRLHECIKEGAYGPSNTTLNRELDLVLKTIYDLTTSMRTVLIGS